MADKSRNIPKRSTTHKEKYRRQFIRTYNNRLHHIEKHVDANPNDWQAQAAVKAIRRTPRTEKLRGVCREAVSGAHRA